VRLAIAPDERGRLRALIEEGLGCDLLLLTGGVSMGKYDLVEQVLGELKAEFYLRSGDSAGAAGGVWFCGADAPARDDGGSAANTRTGVSAPHNIYFLGCRGIRFLPW